MVSRFLYIDLCSYFCPVSLFTTVAFVPRLAAPMSAAPIVDIVPASAPGDANVVADPFDAIAPASSPGDAADGGHAQNRICGTCIVKWTVTLAWQKLLVDHGR